MLYIITLNVESKNKMNVLRLNQTHRYRENKVAVTSRGMGEEKEDLSIKDINCCK